MDSRLVLARRELASLRSEKTIVLAVLIQLFVASFSSFLVVGLVTLYSPAASAAAVSVSVGVTGDAAADLAPVVADAPTRRVVRYQTRGEALDAFERGRVDAVLDANYGSEGVVYVDVVVPEGDFRTTLVVSQLKEALTAFERERRRALSTSLSHRVLAPPDAPRGNPYYGFTYTVLVPLLAFLPVFLVGSIATDSLSEERERGTLELLRVAPVSDVAIVEGKALAAVALAPAQVVLWLALLAANGTRVAHPLALVALVTALAAVLVCFGSVVSLLLDERRSVQLVYSLGALVGFGATALLPANPATAVAKLSIGSPTPATGVVVAGSVLAALLAYAATRLAVGRFGRRA